MQQNNKDISYLSEVDRIRQEIHASVRKEWAEIGAREVSRGIPPSRIFAAIGANHGMTAQNVDHILRKYGDYEGSRKFKQDLKEKIS